MDMRTKFQSIKPQLKKILVHTGHHFDNNMPDVFFWGKPITLGHGYDLVPVYQPICNGQTAEKICEIIHE